MKRKTDKLYQESRSKLGSNTWDENMTHLGINSEGADNLLEEGDGANNKINNESYQ